MSGPAGRASLNHCRATTAGLSQRPLSIDEIEAEAF
jgi:hypothetical protein